jgi:very-short-patch-repair endonuclease
MGSEIERLSGVTLERLASIARTQHALVTTSQALALIQPGQLERLVRTSRLEPVRRGVFRMAGSPTTWLQQVMAACLARPGSYASFRTAAVLWGFEGFNRETIEMTVPGTTRARLEGVIVHESRIVGPRHLDVREQIPVSSVARTLCDLTAVAREWTVEHAVDEALRRNLVSLRALAAVSEELAGRGRRRCTVMRDILEDRAPGYHPGESNPEKRIADLLVRAGLPKPVLQHSVSVAGRRYRIDLCYPELGIAIEYDGWDHHKGRQAFDADRARANDLVVLGLTVLRFTSRSSEQMIIDTVRTAISRATVKTPSYLTD